MNDKFLKAYEEMVEDGELLSIQPASGLKGLKDCLNDNGLLPPEALYLGQGIDDKPVLLNILDPIPGAILYVSKSRKELLSAQTLIAGFMARYSRDNFQFVIITNNPDNWEWVEQYKNCVSLCPVYSNRVEQILLSLASWINSTKNKKNPVILIFDDISSISSLDFDARQNLNYIILRGSKRAVWTFASISEDSLTDCQSYLGGFLTKVYGDIHPEKLYSNGLLSGGGVRQLRRHLREESVDEYRRRGETVFSMAEGDGFFTFYIPK